MALTLHDDKGGCCLAICGNTFDDCNELAIAVMRDKPCFRTTRNNNPRTSSIAYQEALLVHIMGVVIFNILEKLLPMVEIEVVGDNRYIVSSSFFIFELPTE